MIALIFLVSGLLLVAVLLLQAWKDVPTANLTRDPNVIADVPLYIGFLSQAGIFFWSSSAAVSIFSAAAFTRQGTDNEIRGFLFASGILSLWLGLDDVFLLHEEFFPYFGVPEKAVYLAYGALMLCYLTKFRSVILKTEYVLLGLALFFFAASVGLDWVEPEVADIFLLEDGAKVIGIVSWTAYLFRTCHLLLLHRLSATR